MTAISPTAPASADGSPVVIRPVDPAQYRPAMLNVGVIIWLSSELMFFAGLFAAFFTLRAQTKVWPPAGYQLDVTSVGVATLLLVISSGTMQLAVHCTLKRDRVGFIGWLALSFALGALFDGMQISDYVGRNFGIDSSAYGSAFYTLTGFHALHVLGGLLGMIIMGLRGLRSRHFGHRIAPAVEFLSYYWHFVDVVWIALFAAIFLLK